jgi:hypothetical protein
MPNCSTEWWLPTRRSPTSRLHGDKSAPHAERSPRLEIHPRVDAIRDTRSGTENVRRIDAQGERGNRPFSAQRASRYFPASKTAWGASCPKTFTAAEIQPTILESV